MREQLDLIFIFMLHLVTMLLGMLTELYSRPAILVDKDGNRLFGFFDMTRWAGDPLTEGAYLWIHPPEKETSKEELEIKAIKRRFRRLSDRRRNWFRRMVPHFVGFVPYLTAWVIVLQNFLQQLEDVRNEDQDLFERIPWFVPLIVFGTFAIFSTFTFVQMVYQYFPPKYYYQTEVSNLVVRCESSRTDMRSLFAVLVRRSFVDKQNVSWDTALLKRFEGGFVRRSDVAQRLAC